MKVGDFMTYDKCYAIRENKCKIETLSEEQVCRFVSGTASTNYEPTLGTDGSLTVWLDESVHNTFFGESVVPNKVVFKLGSNLLKYAHYHVMVSKKIGTSSKPSDFFVMDELQASNYAVKFLNNPDITNWTRLFVEVWKDNTNVYLRVDGC